MIEYVKIQTVNKRAEDGSKKLIEDTYRDETIEYLKDLPFIWQEKIDGTNISIVWDGHTVEFHGRTANANIPSSIVNHLAKLFKTPEAEELFEQKFGESKFILYGEGFGTKIQGGGSGGQYLEQGVDFALFDVYSIDSDCWLKRDSVHDIAMAFGLREPDYLFEGTIKNAIEFVKTKPKSNIGNANMEGVVGRPLLELRDRMGKRIIVKVKVRDYT